MTAILADLLQCQEADRQCHQNPRHAPGWRQRRAVGSSGGVLLWRLAAGGGENHQVPGPDLCTAHGFTCCAEELDKADKHALFAMRQRAWELGAATVQHQLQLFDIFVKTVLSYGCEVLGWMSWRVASPCRCMRWI